MAYSKATNCTALRAVKGWNTGRRPVLRLHRGSAAVRILFAEAEGITLSHPVCVTEDGPAAVRTTADAPSPESPILVVGMSRSGTKWLSNMLCHHPDLVGAQSVVHGGILETTMLGQADEAFGDLARIDRYVALIELWAGSDFFRAIGANARDLYTANPRPKTAVAMFERVMKEYRDRSGARAWVQKTNPRWGLHAASAVSGSRVIIVHRDFRTFLQSAIKHLRNVRVEVSTTRLAASYAADERRLRQLARQRRTLWIEYEELKQNRGTVADRLCKYLQIEPRPEMLNDKFRPNTSFADGCKRESVLRSRDWAWARGVYSAARCIPLPVVELVRRFFPSPGVEVINGTYSELCREHDLVAPAA